MRKVNSNKGVALASVMIIVMLCAVLAASILRLSYLAFQRKLVETKSDNTFYSAESVVDDVQVMIQSAISPALAQIDEDNSSKFIKAAYDYMTAGYLTADNKLDAAKITYDYYAKLEDSARLAVGNQTLIDQYYNHGKVSGEDGYVTARVGADFSISAIKYDENNMYVSLSVQYVTEDGYTSKIDTNIKIAAPKYASNTKNPLGTYSMFSGNGVDIVGSGMSQKPGVFVQEGNVHIGTQVNSTTALNIKNNGGLKITGDNVVINGDVYVDDNCIFQLAGGYVDDEGKIHQGEVEIRGTIYLGKNAYLMLGKYAYLLCKDIKVKDNNGDYKSVKNGEISWAKGTESYSEYFPFSKSNPTNDSDTLNAYRNASLGGACVLGQNSDNTYSKLGIDEAAGQTRTGDAITWYIGSGVFSSSSELYTTTAKIYFDDSSKIDIEKKVKIHIKENGYDTYKEVDAKFAEFVNVPYLYVATNLGQPRTEYTKYLSNLKDDWMTTKVYDTIVDGTVGNISYICYDPGDDISYNNSSSYKDGFTRYYDDGTSISFSLKNVSRPIAIGFGQEVINGQRDTMYNNIYVLFDDLEIPGNGNTKFFGIYMSAGKVTYKAGEMISYGVSVLDGGRNEANKEKNYNALKAFMDELGKHVMTDGNIDTTNNKYLLINNMFNGGTSVFYSTDSTEVPTDTDKKQSGDLIIIEDWNKD